MNDKETFVAALKTAMDGANPQVAAEEIVRDGLARWKGQPPWLEVPDQGRIETIYADEALTIMNIVWPPKMITEPHEHRMWATIGIYAGRENNILWRREGDTIAPIGAETIAKGEVFSLDDQAIHSVHNPAEGCTGAIHVYGGDFLNGAKSEWDPVELTERPRDMSTKMKDFIAASE